MSDATYQPKVYKKQGGTELVIASGGSIDIESGGSFKLAGTAVTATAAELNAIAGNGLSAAELAVLDGVTAGTVTAGKAVVTTTDKHIDALVISDGGLALGAGAGTAITASAAEINLIDGAIAGTSVASKALALGADKNTDVLALPVSGLKIGAGAGTAVDRTAAEINGLAQGVAAGYKIARSAAPVSLDGSNPTSFAHGLTTCESVTVQLVGSGAPGLGTSVLTAVINGANVDVYAWKPTGQLDTTLIASTGTETFNWIAVGT